MDLSGKVVCITGGSGGLGGRICLAVASRGARVAVVYQQSEEHARRVVTEIRANGGDAIPVQADVTDPAAVQAAVVEVVREFGRLDVLVNDAAYNQWIPFRDLDALTLEAWEKIQRVNVTGPFLCIKAAVPAMRQNSGGRIINIGSVAGLSPSGSSIAYAVSKAALSHMTRCFAVALAPDILVNCVAPGFMEETRMSGNLTPEYQEQAKRRAALGRAVDKDDVARQVVAFAETDSTTGQTLVIDAGRFYH